MNRKRLTHLILGDIRFQYKYGFYFLYFIFTLVYLGLIQVLPVTWQILIVMILIFTDPAAMGLYFMGAIILYEKSERVLDSMAISPTTTLEYVLAKTLAISLISLIVGIVIIAFSVTTSLTFYLIAGIFLASIFFSAIGLIIASNSKSLNSFIIATVPVQLIMDIPAILYLFGWKSSWLLWHPGISIMELLVNGNSSMLALISLIIWTGLVIILADQTIKKMIRKLGGSKL